MSEPNNPHRTAYQRFLQRLFNRILNTAFKPLQQSAVIDPELEIERAIAQCKIPDDPARFNRLRQRTAPGTKWRTRLDLLRNLYDLEQKAEKKPFDAWFAIVWAGKAGIRAPRWAVQQLDAIGTQYMYPADTTASLDRVFGVNADKQKRQRNRLDKALGFRTTGKGNKLSALDIGSRGVQYHELCEHVWTLTLCGIPVTEACRRVARWKNQQPDRRASIYELKKKKPKTLAKQLQGKKYYAWLKANAARLQRDEPARREWLTTNKDQFLAQFPNE
jgi:hypothetical protein